jgi:type II secretion system-associated lipoprotein
VKKAYANVILIIFILTIGSCTTFLKKDDILDIKDFEKKQYILKDDAGEGTRSIKKGTRIKLYITTGDDFIKVYCYPSNTDFVKSERALIVYVFDEDFEKLKFNMAVFENKLYSKVDLAK